MGDVNLDGVTDLVVAFARQTLGSGTRRCIRVFGPWRWIFRGGALERFERRPKLGLPGLFGGRMRFQW